MKEQKYCLVSREIAERCGVFAICYVTQDGRVVMSPKELARLTLTAEEYANGIGAEVVTTQQAKEEIARAGYRLGSGLVNNPVETTEETEETTEDSHE